MGRLVGARDGPNPRRLHWCWRRLAPRAAEPHFGSELGHSSAAHLNPKAGAKFVRAAGGVGETVVTLQL